jgi:hypothetical protein
VFSSYVSFDSETYLTEKRDGKFKKSHSTETHIINCVCDTDVYKLQEVIH